MKRLLFLSLAFALAFLFVACDSGNTGDFKITLKLPVAGITTKKKRKVGQPIILIA